MRRSKEISREKVRAAVRATDAIEVAIGAARLALTERRPINAIGLYMDRWAPESAIARAIEHLQSARAQLREADKDWPSDTDQDAG